MAATETREPSGSRPGGAWLDTWDEPVAVPYRASRLVMTVGAPLAVIGGMAVWVGDVAPAARWLYGPAFGVLLAGVLLVAIGFAIDRLAHRFEFPVPYGATVEREFVQALAAIGALDESTPKGSFDYRITSKRRDGLFLIEFRIRKAGVDRLFSERSLKENIESAFTNHPEISYCRITGGSGRRFDRKLSVTFRKDRR